MNYSEQYTRDVKPLDVCAVFPSVIQTSEEVRVSEYKEGEGRCDWST